LDFLKLKNANFNFFKKKAHCFKKKNVHTFEQEEQAFENLHKVVPVHTGKNAGHPIKYGTLDLHY
jgi:hypothetical protein